MKRYLQDNHLFAFFMGFAAVQQGRLDQIRLGLQFGSSLISGEHHG
jgi:hypothetical protein